MLWLGSEQSITAVHHQVQSRLGLSIVVRDNETTNYAAIRAQLGRWLARDYGIEHIVPGYSEVPRRLLVETLLIHQGGFPSEHKFFMFNGVARLVLLRANYGDRGHEPSSGPEARQQNKGIRPHRLTLKIGGRVDPGQQPRSATSFLLFSEHKSLVVAFQVILSKRRGWNGTAFHARGHSGSVQALGRY